MADDFAGSGVAYAATGGSESGVSITRDGGTTWNQTGLIDTGITATPGCDGFFAAVSPTQTIDNLVNTYTVYAQLDPGIDFSFLSLLVSYRLQVSPAPVTATFGDVPTGHWAFRFIEALAASGITGGCGGGNYCPDNPITRAEMAVFLSAALGLHWAY